MSETITEHEAMEEPVVESTAESVSDEQLIAMLVDRARSEGLQLTGQGGLLQQLTKRVLESALIRGPTLNTSTPLTCASGLLVEPKPWHSWCSPKRR
ncbi:hypothetical protein GCM10010246_81560 [Streptomyces cuspidosporus]|uniref:Transposase n=1 Tax=Streptomyces cuspidosporus TaxID=66882 RepID=A0ABN3HAU4_9ACTN